MSKALALLSGKGGSGKTTLALSIASMLSDCGLKVLLVDCDLSTNGATYFYEEKLSEDVNEINSFYDLFLTDREYDLNFIKINKTMLFLPSVVKITKKNTESYQYKDSEKEKAKFLFECFDENFDIVIYDCQAGYTDILKLLLPYIDVNLVVMEADAISSSAIRSFYLKIGDLIGDKKIYQVFNKVTEDEYKTYSKISGGTVFTNIETIVFDWKIRKAFSVALIPDMEHTSARYGEQVFNICKVIFKEDKIQERLKKFEIKININKKEEQERELREKISNIQVQRKKLVNRLIKIMYLLFVPITLIIILYFFANTVEGYSFLLKSTDGIIMFLSIISVVVALVTSIISMNDLTRDRRDNIKELDENSNKLESILSEKEILENELTKIH